MNVNNSISIKIQDGCSQRCAYCIVCLLRGVSISIPYKDIYKDIEFFSKAENTKEIWLSGINTLEYYDESIGDLCDLIKKLITDFPDIYFSLDFINPFGTEKIFRLIDLMNEYPTHLNNKFILSIQSASNTVLKRMHRPYTKDVLIKIFDYAKSHNIQLRSEIIPGFPGETEEEFLDTYNFIKKYKYDFQTKAFSPRPGTEAISLPNQIPENVIIQRTKAYRELKHELGYKETEED